MAPTLTEQLGTITAIVALALGVVQVLKMLLVKYKVGIVNSLPTPLICVGVSMGLTVLASMVLKTLPGNIFDLLWQAALAAGAASGLFTWLSEPLDSPANKLPPSTPLFLAMGLSLVLTSGGCTGMSNGQKYILTCQSYATTANTLAVLVKAGEFGTADKARIRLLNDACKDIIIAMRDDLIAGNTTFGFDYALTQLQTVLDELLRMQLQAEAAKPKEISSGPDYTSPDRPDGGTKYGVAAGQGGCGVAGDGQSPDAAGDRHGNPGGPVGAREPGQRAQWRTPCPAPLLSLVAEVEWD